MSKNIPEDKLATIVQRVGRSRKRQTILINIDEIDYLQVCMSGAKLGNDHRQGDRELGRIYPKSVLKVSNFSLINRLETRKLKPRTEEDYELQQQWGLEAVNWKAPVGATFKAPESAAMPADASGIPPQVARQLGITQGSEEDLDESEPADDEEDEVEEIEFPDFKAMTKVQCAEFAAKNGVVYKKKDTKETIIAAIIDQLTEDDED